MSSQPRRHLALSTDHLRVALVSRPVVDQAIVMPRRHCGTGHAIATLRTISQQRHVELRAPAADLVTAIAPPAPTPQR